MYGNFVHATNDASHYTKPQYRGRGTASDQQSGARTHRHAAIQACTQVAKQTHTKELKEKRGYLEMGWEPSHNNMTERYITIHSINLHACIVYIRFFFLWELVVYVDRWGQWLFFTRLRRLPVGQSLILCSHTSLWCQCHRIIFFHEVGQLGPFPPSPSSVIVDLSSRRCIKKFQICSLHQLDHCAMPFSVFSKN